MLALLLALSLGCVSDDVAMLKAELAQAQEDVEELQAQLAATQDDADTDAAALTAEIAALEAEIAALEDDLRDLEDDVSQENPFAIVVRTGTEYNDAGGSTPFLWSWSVDGPAVTAVEVVIATESTAYNPVFYSDEPCGDTGWISYPPAGWNMWVIVWEGDVWSCFSPNPSSAAGCGPTIPTLVEEMACD